MNRTMLGPATIDVLPSSSLTPAASTSTAGQPQRKDHHVRYEQCSIADSESIVFTPSHDFLYHHCDGNRTVLSSENINVLPPSFLAPALSISTAQQPHSKRHRQGTHDDPVEFASWVPGRGNRNKLSRMNTNGPPSSFWPRLLQPLQRNNVKVTASGTYNYVLRV